MGGPHLGKPRLGQAASGQTTPGAPRRRPRHGTASEALAPTPAERYTNRMGDLLRYVLEVKRNEDARRGPDGLNQEALNRLRSVAGQINGIEKMLLNNRYCIDILTQIAAARAALSKVGEDVLRRHIATCLSADLSSADPEVRDKAIEELLDVVRRGSV